MSYPVVDFIELSCATWVGDFVVLVILIYEVLLNASRLKQINRLAIGESVRQSWDTAIGVDLQEPWLLLRVLRDVNLGYFVWQSELLQCNGDLNTVGRLGSVKMDVWASCHDVDLV